MCAATPAIFLRPTLTISNIFGIPINTDNNGDGTPTQRLLPYAIVNFIIVLDALLAQYSSGRNFMDDQAAIYRSVEERLETTYGLDGKACVQRFICELTKNPIQDHTMIGELITVVFSPREDGSGTMEEYQHAQLAGQIGHPESCHIAYGSFCPISVFNYFDKADLPPDNNNLEPQSSEHHSPYEQYSHTGYTGYR